MNTVLVFIISSTLTCGGHAWWWFERSEITWRVFGCCSSLTIPVWPNKMEWNDTWLVAQGKRFREQLTQHASCRIWLWTRLTYLNPRITTVHPHLVGEFDQLICSCSVRWKKIWAGIEKTSTRSWMQRSNFTHVHQAVWRLENFGLVTDTQVASPQLPNFGIVLWYLPLKKADILF